MSTGIKYHAEKLLSTEMDRADFIKACGVALLAVVGVNGLTRALMSANTKASAPSRPDNGGYGSRAFGE